MLECLISLIVAVIIAVIVIWVLETALSALGTTPPPPIMMLLRLLVVLLLLIYVLQCFGILGGELRSPFIRHGG
jgi:Na+-driven multidrug efflux pump